MKEGWEAGAVVFLGGVSAPSAAELGTAPGNRTKNAAIVPLRRMPRVTATLTVTSGAAAE